MSRHTHALKVVSRSARIVWNRSPLAGKRDYVQRRVVVGVSEGSRALVHNLRAPFSAGTVAEVEYAAVLDGHTLNVLAPLPRSARRAETAQLVLEHGSTRLRVDARLRPGPDGVSGVEATLLLGERIGGLAVAPGRWRISVELVGPDGTPAVLALIGPGRPTAVKGPAGSFKVCPRTGTRYRTGLTSTGQLRLSVAPPVASAELVRVKTGLTSLSVDFRLLALPAQGAQLLLVTDGTRLTLPFEELPGHDGLLRSTVPLRDVFTRSSGARTWEFSVQAGQGRRLPLQRRAHDLYAPGRFMTLPRVSGVAADGAIWHARPRFSRTMTLQLRSYPAQGIAAPAPTSTGRSL
ncbi:hypothetical protein [Streptacidiphilus sp. EB129]|uniref:hypothetical protein n=1 Tax=Streptacidiphilus sp. EB129 TaxID=3156262 RepID=UPI003518E6F4